MRHKDMRGAPWPMYWKGRQVRLGSRGRKIRPVFGGYRPPRTAAERMTFKAHLRMAAAEQYGRGLTRVL